MISFFKLFMCAYLINSIELYSDRNSFSLSLDTKRNLWLLLHFKDLLIKDMSIYYQVDNGIRQRKKTKHPIRKMRKHHKYTSELINYLRNKHYDIIKLELEFTNGWKIKQRPYTELGIYTNSTKERDNLINKLLNIAGQGPIDILELEINLRFVNLDSDNQTQKVLSRKITYNNSDDKFKLKEYENELEDILITKIIEDLINYLSNI